MAKVVAPLFSFGARGQIGETLVYFPWHGLDCVRSFVVPSNPNTADQQTQRGYFTNAVSDYHDIGLDADDLTAWGREASADPRAMTHFNAFCGEHVDLQVAGQTPDMGFDGGLTDDGDGTFTGSIEEDGAADGVDMLWGTSPTSLINTTAASEAVNVWTASPTDDVSGVIVYARFVIKSGATVIGTTGIYRLKVA